MPPFLVELLGSACARLAASAAAASSGRIFGRDAAAGMVVIFRRHYTAGKSVHPVTLLIIAQGCELFIRNAHAPVRGAAQRLDELGKCDDAHTLEALALLE